MATLPVNSVNSPSMYFKRPSPPASFPIDLSQVNAKTATKTSSVDVVDLNKNNLQEIYSHNMLSSYVDILRQQRRAQALLNQNFSGIGDNHSGQNSVLSNYQTLEYQQNSYDRAYNLKKNMFQSSLNISV